jgi:integrase
MFKTNAEPSDDALDPFDEIEADSNEAASFELETLRLLTASSGSLQRQSSLLAKVETDQTQSFGISEYSLYKEDRWILERPAHKTPHRILFNSEIAGGNALKKALVYHLLPQFHPFGRLRSFVSSTTYAHAFRYLELHLLVPNGIDASAESIRAISVRLINEALDRARDQGSQRQYFLLYFIVSFWAGLSEQKLIPSPLRLDVPSRSFGTSDREKDIYSAIAKEHKGWSPFSEEELSKLVEYAFFWAERAVPVLLEIQQFLKDKLAQKFIFSQYRLEAFEDTLGRQIDGVTICGYKRSFSIQRSVHKGREYIYDRYVYWWRRNYWEAVDRVRDGILILVALISGLRQSELAILTFDDVVLGEDGEWQLNATRFKTSNDPNYFGTSDQIPLPAFICTMVKDYKTLRTFIGGFRSGLLFEQVANPREAKLLGRATARAIRTTGETVGVDSVHLHRFRKTIAEILINRSERNIDLIRMLFGHKSYVMSLRYIARNPFLVHSVAETLETHYADAFAEIATAVSRGAHSGKAAERIAHSAAARPELFKGKLLRITVFRYISHLLQAGEPIFIQRTGIGMYCVSSDSYTASNPPPCVEKALAISNGGDVVPDPSNCQLECDNLVLLEAATETLEKNITFYSNLLNGAPGALAKRVQKQLVSKIEINERHLAHLGVRNDALRVDIVEKAN